MPLELPEGWRDQLPETIRTNGTLDGIDTIDQLAEMVVAGRARESNSIHVPSADAGDEARKTFINDLQAKVPDLVYVGEGADMSNIYDRMGRPKDSTGYELKDIPDPLQENFAELTAKAHELGITKPQMQGITEQIVGKFKDNAALSAENLGKAVDEVKAKYGEAYDETTTKLGNFAKQIGFDDSLVEAVKSGHVGLDNIQAMEKLMKGFDSPGPRIGDDPGGDDFVHVTPEQAELQIAEMQGNKDHPYWNPGAPGHEAAKSKMLDLVRAADAGKPKSDAEKFREAMAGAGE